MDVQSIGAWIRNLKPGGLLILHAKTENDFQEILKIFYQVSAEFETKGWGLSLFRSYDTVICNCH